MNIKKVNELYGEDDGPHEPDDHRDYIQNYIVIDPQYGNVPKKIKKLILNLGDGQNTYCKYYPGDGFYKPLSEHKDPSKAVFYKKGDDYAYEIGSDEISDWLFSEGFKPKDQILFLIWW
jgi:hypothetical protein